MKPICRRNRKPDKMLEVCVCREAVESKLSKLETSHTVILAPTGECTRLIFPQTIVAPNFTQDKASREQKGTI